MNDPFHIAESERGVVRVFTTDLDPEGSAAITPANLQKLLGEGVDLDPSRVEVFPSQVLKEMGLSHYLQEGYGIPPEDLAGVSAALDALSGLLILIASSAFQGRAQTLDPNSAIRFVGAYREPGMAAPLRMAETASAEGRITLPDGTETTSAGRMGPGPMLLLGAVLAAAALVLFAVF